MSSLKPLIQKEKIRIDDHLWGTGEQKNWDRNKNDIHLEKITEIRIHNKNVKLTIKIPLNSKRDITISDEMGYSYQDIPSSLKKEIKTALSQSKIRTAFINDLEKILKNYTSIVQDEKKVSKALEKIANHFEMKWRLESRKIYDTEKRHIRTEELWLDEDERIYSFEMNNKYIEAGEFSTIRKKLL